MLFAAAAVAVCIVSCRWRFVWSRGEGDRRSDGAGRDALFVMS